MTHGTPHVAVVVLAGGSGTRLGLAGGANKVYVPLDGRPLLAWSLRTLYEGVSPAVTVVVCRDGEQADAEAAARIGEVPNIRLAVGGTTRTASEIAGIVALRDDIVTEDVDVVLVHDGARPFPAARMLTDLVDAAHRHGAAVPAISVDEGLFVRETDHGQVHRTETVDLRAVQTPQAVAAPALLAAADAALDHGWDTLDTISLVARAGGPVAVVVDGDPDNIKVTRPGDVESAAAVAHRRHRP